MHWNPEGPSFDDRRWHQIAGHTSRHKCKFESYTRLIDIYIRNCGGPMSFIFLCLHNANYKLLLSLFCVHLCRVLAIVYLRPHCRQRATASNGDNAPFQKILRPCLVLLVINNFKVAEAVRSALCALWMLNARWGNCVRQLFTRKQNWITKTNCMERRGPWIIEEYRYIFCEHSWHVRDASDYCNDFQHEHFDASILVAAKRQLCDVISCQAYVCRERDLINSIIVSYLSGGRNLRFYLHLNLNNSTVCRWSSLVRQKSQLIKCPTYYGSNTIDSHCRNTPNFRLFYANLATIKTPLWPKMMDVCVCLRARECDHINFNFHWQPVVFHLKNIYVLCH